MIICCDSRTKDSQHIVINDEGLKPIPSIQIIEKEMPIVDDAVVVHIKLASISSFDRYQYQKGKTFTKNQKKTMGQDFSGVVKYAPDNSIFRSNDKIFGYSPDGSFCTLLTIDHKLIQLLPSKMHFDKAATIPFSGCIAYYIINQILSISPGQRILIHDASKGEGYFAIQFAKMKGAYVFASVENARHIEAILDLDVNECDEFWLESKCPKDLDYIIDFTYKETGSQCFVNNLNPGGTIIYLYDEANYTSIVNSHKNKDNINLIKLSYPLDVEIIKSTLPIISQLLEKGKLEAHFGEKISYRDFDLVLKKDYPNTLGKDLLIFDDLEIEKAGILQHPK